MNHYPMPPSNSFTGMFFSILFLITLFFTSSLSQVGIYKETTLTLYFQDYPARPGSIPGPNATTLPITGIPGSLWNFTSFGTIFASDDPITQGPSSNSTQIARGQGIYVVTAIDGSGITTLLSIVFTNKEYNGSSLELFSGERQSEVVREVAVVGGTGKFRFARGYALFETIFSDPVASYDVVRCNVTVEHRLF